MTDILLEGGVEKSHCNSQVGVCVYLSSHTKNERVQEVRAIRPSTQHPSHNVPVDFSPLCVLIYHNLAHP